MSESKLWMVEVFVPLDQETEGGSFASVPSFIGAFEEAAFKSLGG